MHRRGKGRAARTVRPAQATLFRSRHKIEKPDDALQPVAGEDADVEAAGKWLSASGAERPGEANDVVVRVDLAGAAEAEAWELALHSRDHGVDAVVPLAGHQRVEVAAVRRPGPGDQRPARGRVGLVPGVDVAIDDCRHISCGCGCRHESSPPFHAFLATNRRVRRPW